MGWEKITRRRATSQAAWVLSMALQLRLENSNKIFYQLSRVAFQLPDSAADSQRVPCHHEERRKSQAQQYTPVIPVLRGQGSRRRKLLETVSPKKFFEERLGCGSAVEHWPNLAPQGLGCIPSPSPRADKVCTEWLNVPVWCGIPGHRAVSHLCFCRLGSPVGMQLPRLGLHGPECTHCRWSVAGAEPLFGWVCGIKEQPKWME